MPSSCMALVRSSRAKALIAVIAYTPFLANPYYQLEKKRKGQTRKSTVDKYKHGFNKQEVL